MPSGDALEDSLIALAWSLWSELGVSGWTRHHSAWFVDPEPLVVFTAWLGDRDARLRDESTDWCIRFGTWLSGARLSNTLGRASAGTIVRFGELAATVSKHSTLRWRGATKPRAFVPTGRSHLETFEAPSLVGLRLRAIVGVGARAEVLRVFLASPGLSLAASELVDEVGFKKRNVAEALKSLQLGGVLGAERMGNRYHYRLLAPERWKPVLGALPNVWPRWSLILPMVATLADERLRVQPLPQRVQSVELAKLLRKHAGTVGATRLPEPPVPGPDPPFAEAFSVWLERVVDDLAHGKCATTG